MNNNTIVALYDTIEQAKQAVQALKDAGYTGTDISLVANDTTGEYARDLTVKSPTDGAGAGATAGAIIGGLGGLLVGIGALVIPGIGPVLAAGPLAAAVTTLVGAGVGAAAGGLLGALVDLGVPEEEAGYYAEGVRRGGALVTAHVDDSHVDDARSLLQGFNPVNINERATAWKSAGWTGYTKDAKPYTAEEVKAERARYMANMPKMTASSTKMNTNATNMNTSSSKMNTNATNMDAKNLDKGGEITIPVVEEKINVSKKEVDQGGVRVHKYVQERPVEADVSLREEHIKVDRRPVDRPTTAGIADTFKETTIEVTQKAEQAVINKEARVVEEVVVRKDVGERTETVRDTVRRTDVKVEEMGTGMTGKNYATDWQTHYQKTFANTGNQFDYYQPAYTYGETLRGDKRYSNWDWARLEPEARRTWESRYDSPWDKVKGAVRYAWEGVKDAVR